MLAPEVPGGVVVSSTGLGVRLLCVDEVGELDSVSDEEDRGVVANEIIDSFFSVMLDGEPSWISDDISGSLLSSDSGESGEDGSLLADLVEEVSLRVFRDVSSNLEISMSSSSLSVDDSLRDSLRIKLLKLVNEMSVLKKSGSSDASGL